MPFASRVSRSSLKALMLLLRSPEACLCLPVRPSQDDLSVYDTKEIRCYMVHGNRLSTSHYLCSTQLGIIIQLMRPTIEIGNRRKSWGPRQLAAGGKKRSPASHSRWVLITIVTRCEWQRVDTVCMYIYILYVHNVYVCIHIYTHTHIYIYASCHSCSFAFRSLT